MSRTRSPRKKKGKAKGAPRPAADPGTNGGESTKPAKVRRTLNREQTLAVQLMQAREVIKQKNDCIVSMQTKYSAQITGLESELDNVTRQLMAAANDVEARNNDELHRDLGLPEGTVNLVMGPDGLYYYEEDQAEDPPSEDPSDPEEPDEGANETGEDANEPGTPGDGPGEG